MTRDQFLKFWAVLSIGTKEGMTRDLDAVIAKEVAASKARQRSRVKRTR